MDKARTRSHSIEVTTTKGAQTKAGPLAKHVAGMLFLEKLHTLLHVPVTKQFLTSSNFTRIAKTHELIRRQQLANLRMGQDLWVRQQ